jgi:hypothetical protein
MSPRRLSLLALLALLTVVGVLPARVSSQGSKAINVGDLRTWLTYIASDELEGRATFSAGLGLAAGYIQSHLQQWGAQPAGDGGTYLQTVRVQAVRATSRSSLTVRVGHETRTFKDGEGVTFPRHSGVSRTFSIDRVEFAGYGLEAPGAGHSDFRGKRVEGAAVVFLGATGPTAIDQQVYRRLLAGRGRYAIDQLRAASTIGPQGSSGASPRPARNAGAERTPPDFTTAQRLDLPVPPAVTVSDQVFEFLFSRAPARYQELKRKAEARETLPSFGLDQVSLTYNIDVDYAVVRTQLTHNIVAIVPGSDPVLKDSYVAFGAHYDHVGYADAEISADGSRRPGAPGRIAPGEASDRIWNGADDDGSGIVALMAMVRAAMEAPRPARSLLFVWHAGEERGLWGSRYFADHPSVPMDRIVAQLNVDMIGRNRDDKESEANTVYLVGSDRISSELHEISRLANQAFPQPLTLNYELNDPADLEQLYSRSDHYSYALKGIPVIFFTTGLHGDYHTNTDHVSKIEFEKLARVTRLVYETGLRLANRERPPVRDHLGPRAGKGAS